VCSSRDDRESVFKALELGAVDYIIKPGGGRHGLARIEDILVARVKAAAEAHLAGDRGAAAAPVVMPPPSRRAEVIAIAASTGGPAAIQQLVRHHPPQDREAVHARHVQVEQEHVRARARDQPDRLLAVGGHARDRQVGPPAEQLREPEPVERRVVGDDEPVRELGLSRPIRHFR
jgi:chemotaxis response regulator CheB